MSALPTPASADDLARLRRLIEHSRDMLSRHAPDGTCLYTSPACRQLLGYEPEELIWRSGYVSVHPDDLADIAQSQDEVMAGSGLHTILCRVRHKQGRDVWIESTVHALRDPATGSVVELHASRAPAGAGSMSSPGSASSTVEANGAASGRRRA